VEKLLFLNGIILFWGAFMGWKDVLRAIFIEKAEDWTFQELSQKQLHNGKSGEPIETNNAYVTIKLRSMRVVNIRKGLSKFYGAVHSFITLGHLGIQKAEFQVLTTPTDLQGIDAKNLHKVLSFDKDLLTSVPYRGDGLEIELGLFSIKAENLADSFLKVLEGMSDVAGVSFVSSAIPFVKPLSDAVDLLVGTSDDQILEIGLSTKVSKPKTGTFVVMRAPQNLVDLSEFTLDEAYRLVDKNGKNMGDYPYIVYSIEASSERENWYQIPEISKAFNSVNEAVRKGDEEKIDEAFGYYTRLVLTSPDLIDADAEKMVQKMDEKIKKIKGLPKRRTRGMVKGIDLGTLKDLNIYGS
jgi:hypothetical protein